MKIAPDEIRGPRPNSIFASHRDASNPFFECGQTPDAPKRTFLFPEGRNENSPG
jgi:hypothetical protein